MNAFELMKAMIEAGAAAVQFEDQLASVKKCGHRAAKFWWPTQEAIQKLVAARLAADVTGVPTLLVARTDADAADLITSDCDPYDSEFITGERTSEGFFRTHAGIEQAISRGLAYAPYADLVWCETSTPDLELARRFAQPSTRNIRANCWLITARRRSTGRKTSTTNYCQLPAAAVGYGLQVPVHHPGRYPQHVVQHV
ncbi:isocitrate lyase/phosphoenolpyruvate mutase family protein [Escherichia coli]|nr:isocitrate lyase/phosphoenolpyruvate mutase family protein [Escherichia coli]MDG5898290.1 isocitrate lyase/phosphoenolpyruvate mutase family protein [Escherichia coli]